MTAHTKQSILKYGLLAVLLVPLLFNHGMIFPFITFRTYFLYILIDLLFVVFIWEYGYNFWRLLWKNKIMQWVGIFFGVKLLTDILGFNFWQSIWSDYERMMGLYTWLHIFLFVIMLAVVYNNPKDYKKLFLVNTGVATLVSLYGLAELAGLTPGKDVNRLISTIGNPAFLGSYLALSIIISTYLFAKNYKSNYKWWYFAGSTTMLITLYLTATRGAVLGLGLGISTAALYIVFFIKRNESVWQKWRKYSITLLVLMIVSALALVALQSKEERDFKSLTLRRLTSISLQDQSVRARFLLYGVGLKAARERIWLGYGESNIEQAIDKHFDPRIFEPWFDSTHNSVLDLLISHGILGVLVTLGLFVVLIRSFHRIRENLPLEAVFGISILFVYLIQSIFLFDSLVLLIPLALIIGFTAILEPTKSSEASGYQKNSNQAYPVLVTILVVVALLAYNLSIRALTDTLAGYKIAYSPIGKFSEAEALFRSGYKKAFFGHRILEETMLEITEIILRNPKRYEKDEMENWLKFLVSTSDEVDEIEGETAKQSFEIARLLSIVPEDLRSDWFPIVYEKLEHSKTLSPGRPIFDDLTIRTLATEEKLAEARLFTLGSLKRYPARRGEFEYKLALIELSLGNITEAVNYALSAPKHGRNLSPLQFEDFATVAIEKEAWDEAALIYEATLELDPDNLQTWINLSLIYKNMGDFDKSREATLKVINIDPFTKLESDEFLKELEELKKASEVIR
jgi:O-antigen ligase/tetratricopeptide (TPR) repeat protein